MSRLRTLATIAIVASAAFYLGGLVEFQYGGFAPDWVKIALGYQPPKQRLDQAALEEVFTSIQQHYVRGNADGQTLTRGAASGMVEALGDRFSRYLTPEEFQANQSFIEGRFAGIGTTVLEKGDQIAITSVLPRTPAQKAGLQPGDLILAVDGADTRGWTADELANRVRGKAGTHVVLRIDRQGQLLTFDLIRETIEVPSVATHIFDGKVLYIRIFEFGDRTAQDFDAALKDNLQGQVSRVLLDLRDNPGGLVDAADDVISEFISKGTATILVHRDGREEVKSVTGTGRAFSNPLAVLVNTDTASASEITAGALQDAHRGKLVGVKTFGKGSVQEDFPLRDGDLHLTIAAWLTPQRHSIDKNGITPDEVVTLDHPEDAYGVDRAPDDFSRDRQLLAALTALE